MLVTTPGREGPWPSSWDGQESAGLGAEEQAPQGEGQVQSQEGREVETCGPCWHGARAGNEGTGLCAAGILQVGRVTNEGPRPWLRTQTSS